MTQIQLFLQFDGPATLLVQSRGARVRDIMSDRDVNEIADTPAGATYNALNKLTGTTDQRDYQRAAEDAVSEAPVPSRTVEELTQELKGVSQTIATIRDGRVEFEQFRQQNTDNTRK